MVFQRLSGSDSGRFYGWEDISQAAHVSNFPSVFVPSLFPQCIMSSNNPGFISSVFLEFRKHIGSCVRESWAKLLEIICKPCVKSPHSTSTDHHLCHFITLCLSARLPDWFEIFGKPLDISGHKIGLSFVTSGTMLMCTNAFGLHDRISFVCLPILYGYLVVSKLCCVFSFWH